MHSGIQESNGGVARYHRTDTGRNLPVSTEITGYALSTFVYLHDLSQDSRFLDAAQRAARFLTRHAWDPEAGVMPFETAPAEHAYFFDCGIIVRGLLAVWRVCRQDEFLEAAVRLGHAMARDFSAGDSEYHPILRLPDKGPVARDEGWSRNPGCYQLKSAMGWHDLWEATGEARFRAEYERAKAYALGTYAAFLPGHPEPARVMDRLHAYSYFLEGLLPCSADRRAAAAICDGLRRLSGYLREIGPVFERSDVYAQLLRMRIYAEWMGIAPVDREAAAQEARELAGFQRADGGFWFGRRGQEWLPYVNPVSAAFGMQALALWERYLAGGAPAHRHDLI